MRNGSPNVHSVTHMGERNGRKVFRIVLSGDPDWNGNWHGIEVYGNPDCAIQPGDLVWYGGDSAYWTEVIDGVKQLPGDHRFERHGYDFTAWRAKKPESNTR